ncbi:biopolymer transporter ExbD [Hyalangium minutum]
MKSEINVTPLVDVVLVLLIIFMVVTPLMQRGKAVALPKASHSSEKGETDPLVVSVTVDEKLYVESELSPDAEHFKERMQEELRTQPSRRVLLKADQALACAQVQKVMALIRTSGAKTMGLGVDELKAP